MREGKPIRDEGKQHGEKRFLEGFSLTGKTGIGCMKGTGDRGVEGSICMD